MAQGYPTDYLTEGTWVNTLGVDNDDKSKIVKKKKLLTNIMTAI